MLAVGLAASGLAQDAPTNAAQRIVIVTGVGTDVTAARKNAYSRAVEEAVGVVVATEMIVKEEKVIHDQILTYSGALVSQSETLRSEERNGLFEVKIRATVEMRPLLLKLKAANVAVREVSGESLFASTVTQLKQRNDAQALITEALRDFPLNVMHAEVWGKPQIAKSDGQKATLACKVRLTIDRARFAVFSERLRGVLRQTGHQPVATQLTASDAPAVSHLPGFGARKEPGMFAPFPKHPTDAYYLFVHVQSDPTDSRSTWEMYRVRPELAKTLLLLSVNSLRLTIRFFDGNDHEVLHDESGLFFLTQRGSWSLRLPIGYAFCQASLDRFNFVPMGINTEDKAVGLLEEFRHPFRASSGNDNFIYIAPYFALIDKGGSYDRGVVEAPGGNIYDREIYDRERFYTLTCDVSREIETALDPLQSIKKVVAGLSSDIPLPPDPKKFSTFLDGLSFDEPTRSEQLLGESLAPGAMTNSEQPAIKAGAGGALRVPVPNRNPVISTPPPAILPPSRGGLQPSRGLQTSGGL